MKIIGKDKIKKSYKNNYLQIKVTKSYKIFKTKMIKNKKNFQKLL